MLLPALEGRQKIGPLSTRLEDAEINLPAQLKRAKDHQAWMHS
jgi:hypothetical protein